jgi:hypothetical protein
MYAEGCAVGKSERCNKELLGKYTGSAIMPTIRGGCGGVSK